MPASTEPMNGRVELHVHLDGSIPPATLLRTAQRRQLRLPGIDRVPTSVNDVISALHSTGAVWKWFDLVNDIIGGDEATLTDVATDFVGRQARQNVTYTEVRYDPVRPAHSRLANESVSIRRVVLAIEKGLRVGCERHGIEVYQLLCAMRGAPASQCYEVAELAASVRSGLLGGVVGLDLAGDELHYNNSRGDVEGCFTYAKSHLMLNTTVHAGEMADDEAQDVRTAIEVMHADRIGHGYAAVHDLAVLNLLVQSHVHVESCPAGHHDNLNATGMYHHLGLNFGLNTDDPAAYFQNVTLSQVDALVTTRLGFTPLDLSRAYGNARAAAFAPSAARVVAQQKQDAIQLVFLECACLFALTAAVMILAHSIRHIKRAMSLCSHVPNRTPVRDDLLIRSHSRSVGDRCETARK